MKPHRRDQAHRPTRPTGGSASWLALLAAATLGSGMAGAVRTQVRLDPEADTDLGRRSYRLVVQSYAANALRDGELPGATRRPLGSVQRAVTREELERGVCVGVPELGREAGDDDGVMVAWIEPGEPDLEFDGRRARPGRDALWGRASASGADVAIRLDRRVG